jgi:hypothetical protein
VIPIPEDEDEIDWDAEIAMDPILQALRDAKLPLTRENYIDLKYGEPGTEDHPEEWTEEHEAALPHPFQRSG